MGLNKIDAKVDNSVQRREISDNVISFAELALDPNVEAIRGAIEVKLAGFERHMPALLDILRSANRCRSAPGSFALRYGGPSSPWDCRVLFLAGSGEGSISFCS